MNTIFNSKAVVKSAALLHPITRRMFSSSLKSYTSSQFLPRRVKLFNVGPGTSDYLDNRINDFVSANNINIVDVKYIGDEKSALLIYECMSNDTVTANMYYQMCYHTKVESNKADSISATIE
jgi:hypothetical protein